jgi:chaperonin cofactor prefoldin
MDFTNILRAGDPGALLKQELEEAISPVTNRVDALEKKLDLLILTAKRIEDLLKSMKPVIDLIKKLPFLK